MSKYVRFVMFSPYAQQTWNTLSSSQVSRNWLKRQTHFFVLEVEHFRVMQLKCGSVYNYVYVSCSNYNGYDFNFLPDFGLIV